MAEEESRASGLCEIETPCSCVLAVKPWLKSDISGHGLSGICKIDMQKNPSSFGCEDKILKKMGKNVHCIVLVS